jgi:inosose dehydratase
MLFGNAPCSWGITYPTGNTLTWNEYLDQVAAAGYRGTELGPFGFLPKDGALLRDELARRDLTLIGATHVHTFNDPASGPELMRTLDDLSALLSGLGARHLVIMDESESYPASAEGVLDAEGWRAMVAMIREARALVEGGHGLTLSFHPHLLTAVEYEPQIDRLLADTDIALCLDTGHHAVRGQDPVAYMRKVMPRIAYMHLKNADAAVRARVLDGTLAARDSYAAGIMCPLPDGAVDIREVMRVLDEAAFAGPVVVEQDVAENATETPLELARRNLEYLKGVVG